MAEARDSGRASRTSRIAMPIWFALAVVAVIFRQLPQAARRLSVLAVSLGLCAT